MSTFGGLVEEIPGISLDRFDDENLSSSAYFLTHLHRDHIQGLDETFFRRLKQNKRYIHCTRLTKLFLVGKYHLSEDLSQFIKELRSCSPTIVDYVHKNRRELITVICIPAGHCPGSVMFIFERNDARVLCTGDFRICPDDLPKIKPLNVREGEKIVPLKFDKIYLDTTFLNPDFPEFPTRRRSLEEICRSTSDWLSRDSKNIVSLECSAIYGSEFLYIELMEKFKKPVHVKHWVFQDYSRIDELARSITNDPEKTSIHACANKKNSNARDILPCRRDADEKNILTIVVSAARWKNRNLSESISEWDETRKNRFYVCCSMHPSYNELKAFVDYFEPAEIYPCVDPPMYCKVGATDILNELRRKVSLGDAKKRVNYDLGSLIGNNSKRAKSQSSYISDDSSD